MRCTLSVICVGVASATFVADLFYVLFCEPAAILVLRIADGITSLLISCMEFLVGWHTSSVQLQVAHANSWNFLALFFGMLLLLPKVVCR